MSTNFYDKVANKFGKYHTGAKKTKEHPAGDPEEIFKQKLLKLGKGLELILDVGCADGRFTLSMAPSLKKIIAIDMSDGMLTAARKLQSENEISNVIFEKQNAFKTTYDDQSFDLVYSRRGPTPFEEAFRLLKHGGYFVEIDIGKQDCRQIKEVFGRGQSYGQWDTSRKEYVKQKAESLGFKIVYSKDFFYDEYYPSYESLDLFLQGVPIFEDFDSDKDKESLMKYVDKFKTKKGIRLPRHRLVSILQKP